MAINKSRKRKPPFDRWLTAFSKALSLRAQDGWPETGAGLVWQEMLRHAQRILEATDSSGCPGGVEKQLHEAAFYGEPLFLDVCYLIWIYVAAPGQRELIAAFDRKVPMRELAATMERLESQLKKFSQSPGYRQYMNTLEQITGIFDARKFLGVNDDLPTLFQAMPQLLHPFRAIAEALCPGRLVKVADRKRMASRALVWLFEYVQCLLARNITATANAVADLLNQGYEAAGRSRSSANEFVNDADSVLKRIRRFKRTQSQEFQAIARYVRERGLPHPDQINLMLIPRQPFVLACLN
jgi:hypothetical protein